MSDIADYFTVVKLNEGEVLFRQGDPADNFYFVHSGKVRVTQRIRSGERELAVLVPGDYFGEGALLTRNPRSATVTGATDSTLLRLDHADFEKLIREIPDMKPNLLVSIQSHQIARQIRLPWLGADEVVYFIARKHPFFLARNLALPVGGLVLGLIFFIVFYFGPMNTMLAPFICTGVFIAAMVLWALWNLLDWSNDYYIVTSQRVVWLERVAGIYDSRQESPLSSLLSVGVNTSQFGRILGFGNVNIRTFTGVIVFQRVSFPEQVAALVEEQWFRAKASSRREEMRAMNQSIRKRLGLEIAGETTPTPPAPPNPTIVYKPGIFERLFSNFYTMRFEVGDVVTYRKHWFILIQQTWLPGTLITLVVAAIVARLLNVYLAPSLGTVLLLGFLLLIGLGLWYLYEYVDWRNDIYQITPEQILDIDKTPLGREEKKAAPLENILSIQYERLGLIGLIFNFGTVYITVGGTKFTFDYVFNPSEVQQDVFRRMGERIARKKKAEATAERERVSDWFASYYDVVKQSQPPRSYYGQIPLPTNLPPVSPQLPPDVIPEMNEEDYEDTDGYSEAGDYPPPMEF